MIIFENISKSFDSNMVLTHFSLRWEDGEILGIQGPSGIGKSTLAKLLTGLLIPDEGEITVDGSPLFKNKHYQKNVGSDIQMVFQDPFSSFDPYYTFAYLLQEPLNKIKLSKEEKTRRIEEVLDEVDLPFSILKKKIRQVSGGEAQRLAIARCLLLNPRYLILDEATSMLDTITQASVLDLMKRIQGKRQLSLLLISHDHDLLAQTCQRVINIERS